MSRPPSANLQSGRVQQKARTRKALVDAAVEFVRAGRDFSVAEVADAAGVGRATAYCYFRTKESLHAQAVLTFMATTGLSFKRAFRRTPDVEARVRTVVEGSDASIRSHEAQYRAMLRSSLENDPTVELPRRPSDRKEWLTEALEPLRPSLDRAAFERLVGALSLCIGIEAHVTLRDVCGLGAADARAIKTWAAEAILSAALHERAP